MQPPPTGFQHAYLEIEQGDRTQAWAELEHGAWERFECWFNPKDYTITKSNTWKDQPQTGKEVGDMQFGGGSPATLSLDLVFDAAESSEKDVVAVTDKLVGTTSVRKPDQTEKNTRRPPAVRFGWGAVRFVGVVRQLTLQFTLFEVDGTPVRAHVKLELAQVPPPSDQKQNPTTTGQVGIRTHTIRDGDTLHSIAYATYGDPTLWRSIALANTIEDPLRLRRGMVISIPRMSA